ncbi:L-lactate dehydrogenase complex protein LldG [Tistlia consotensis]|uniref:L-lactate dehydrogenase complex protein LldG n=1 Tax=Tistlia consotensis USBA 355 TaxID=560819 RepID=A0A1Y6BG08_9PROT|nr:lactate utilization protein [Tistlia consotensis]SMF08882.1 L-lactate dehydrogenase complex protein LldG [Tistlia consotensis USBA 355]SNR35052.1 L-lactate dehydrogenase complex protein LldG [Tistlia consotensis]
MSGERSSTARGQILGAIRRAVKRDGTDAGSAVERRLAEHPEGPRVERARLPHEALVALFVEKVEAVQGSVARVDSPEALPEAVADYLKRHNLPTALRVAPDPALTDLPWQEKAPLLSVSAGRAEAADAVSLTGCFAGVAETGTLMLASGPEAPTTLNFLPETHLVVLRESDLVGPYEEAWRKLRAREGAEGPGGALPRTVNFVTGPSRTGDIEQKIQLGAHGPRRLHVLLVADGEG